MAGVVSRTDLRRKDPGSVPGVGEPSLDARAKLASLDTQWSNALADRKTADTASAALLRSFVNAVKAHPKFGEDSGLYTALGYVPKRERRSGLTRRREPAAAKAPSEAS